MTLFNAIQKQKEFPKLPFIFFGIWSFIVLCRPQEYITSLQYFRPSLVLSLIAIIVYIMNKAKLPALPRTKQIKLYAYLVIVIIVSIPFSYYRRHSFDEFMIYCNVILYFYLFLATVNSVPSLRRLIFVYCIGTSIYACFSLRSGVVASNNRLSFGSTFDPNDIAYYLISFLTFNLIFINKTNRFYVRIASVLSIIISLVAILKTGSRGGLISLLAMIIVLLMHNTNTLNMSQIKKIIFCILGLLSLQFVNINTERYKTILSPESDYNYNDETGRVAIWKTGIYLMATHPLTGVGFRCFNEGIGRDRERRGLPPIWQAPHNSLVQIGTETGVIGLCLFLVLSVNAYNIFKSAAKTAQSEDLNAIGEMARTGFIGHFVSAMFLSQAYSAYWVFYIILSVVLKNFMDIEGRLCDAESVS